MINPVVTAAQINTLLGETEPLMLERIVETGASFDEVAEALSAIEDEDAYAKMSHKPSSSRVLEVRRVLEELLLTGNYDEEELTAPR